MRAVVTHLHASSEHRFSKEPREALRLRAGMGVEGDAHYGATVRHRSRVGGRPRPNLRQVHLIASEVYDQLLDEGFDVRPGDLGENVTSRGIDLSACAVGTVVRLGGALVVLTGLRNPCRQIEQFRPGLLAAVRGGRTGAGTCSLRHRPGVMAVVVHGGEVRIGDGLLCSPPPGDPIPLDRV
jgi:MOSC domain-containing protein YiiM